MSPIIALFAGILTLLSPCTLPIIPLVFASVRGKKGQLVALLAGMVIMFTVTALLVTVTSHWVTTITAVGRGVALVFLTISALMLLSSRIAQFISAPLVSLGNRINESSLRQRGLIPALLAGMAVGLLWSPCAGPVLGAIISYGVMGQQSASVGVLLAAYGSGCALMLAALWISGQGLLKRLRPGVAIISRLRQLAGGLMLASVFIIASGTQSILYNGPQFAMTLEQRLSQYLAAPQAIPELQPTVETSTVNAMPSLTGGTHWFNHAPVSATSLKGKVVLVDFWTLGCINCQHTLAHVRTMANKYQAQGLFVLGVHTPEYPWERDPNTVTKAIDKWQLPYTIVADNNYAIWNRFANQYWPAQYIFDARGVLRYSHFGEGDYAGQEKVIQQLLKEAHA